MDYSSTSVVYLTFDLICDVNREMIENMGGGYFVPPQNLFNSGSLNFILADVIDPDLNALNHHALKEIAAKISHLIISRHVFNDGNKRTGAHIAFEFLRANRIPVFLDSSIIDLTLSIASGDASIDDLYDWLLDHQES